MEAVLRCVEVGLYRVAEHHLSIGLRMDLFKTAMPENKLHEYFKQISNEPKYTPVRDVIQSWGGGLLERRGEQKKFVNEFQTTFNSSIWELYLNKVFIELGFSVDYTKSSPDFFVTTIDGREFCVEAVISDRSQKTSQKLNGIDVGHFKNRSTIKLAGKLKDKRDMFTGDKGNRHPYSSLDHVQGNPFVVAIAPFDSDMSLLQNNEIINRVLFGLDSPDDRGMQKTIKSVAKPSGAPVDLGIFTNSSYKEISAVIFSTTGTFGKAVVESGINKIVRATNYREMKKKELTFVGGLTNIGTKFSRLGPLNYIKATRYESETSIFGADMHIYHSRDHRETHFDGLQIYYNPYAEIPFDRDIMHPKEIAHNFYDSEKGAPVHEHPDGALVSRQLFDVDRDTFKFLLKSNSFYS